MRLSSVIIFAAFVLSATASPIDGYIPRSNSIRRRTGHIVPIISGQASQQWRGGPHTRQSGNRPDSLVNYFDKTTIENYDLASGAKLSDVEFHDGRLILFGPFMSNAQPSQEYFFMEYNIPHDTYIQDFYGPHGKILLSQVKLDPSFADYYSRKHEHQPEYMRLEQRYMESDVIHRGMLPQTELSPQFAHRYSPKNEPQPEFVSLEKRLWMASYPEEPSERHSFTFKEDRTESNGMIHRRYFDPSGVQILAIKGTRGGEWSYHYSQANISGRPK